MHSASVDSRRGDASCRSALRLARYHGALWCVGLALCLSFAPGCHLMRHGPTNWFQAPPPVAFTSAPTVDDIVRVVNSNTAPIQQLSADSATLSVAGYPPLRGNLHLERPKRFRLQASLLSPEVDLGSNDELFWVWINRSPDKAVLFARHEAFARSPVRQQMPLDPLWVTEALGLVQLDPLAQYEGPVARPTGELEIRTRVSTPQGELVRTYAVHASYGWVLEQRIQDSAGQILASARASRHRYDPNVGVALPQYVEMSIPPAELALSLSVGAYRFNQPVGNPDALWSPPQIEGYPLVDITDPRFQPAPAASPAANPAAPVGTGPARAAPVVSPTGATNSPNGFPSYTPQPPPGANQPRYRGYTSPWR